MLYDPKWETKTKEPSLADFIAWLETQPPEKTYKWLDAKEPCLCDQYFAFKGVQWKAHDEIEERDGVRINSIALHQPHTFGAALSRCRALLTEQ